MTGFMSFIDFIVLAGGVYIVYAAFKLKNGGDLSSQLIWDKNTPFSQCRDKDGFRAYVSPRLLIAGIIIAVDGALGVACTKFDVYKQAYPFLMVLTVAIIVWYATFMKKAQKMFF